MRRVTKRRLRHAAFAVLIIAAPNADAEGPDRAVGGAAPTPTGAIAPQSAAEGTIRDSISAVEVLLARTDSLVEVLRQAIGERTDRIQRGCKDCPAEWQETQEAALQTQLEELQQVLELRDRLRAKLEEIRARLDGIRNEPQ